MSPSRALATNPAVVLLDEPFAALDPMLRIALRKEVAALLKSQKTTALLVTHDQEEALSLSDYVAVMFGGIILQRGTPFEVYERPATPWVARFVGNTVELPGRYRSGRVHCALGSLAAEVMEIGVEDDDQVRVILRPEWLELEESGGDGTVTAVSYAGHDALVAVNLGDDFVAKSRVPSGRLPTVGSHVGLKVTQPALVYR